MTRQEAITDAMVRAAYLEAFERDPDPAGFEFWRGVLEPLIRPVAQAFAEAPEGAVKHPQMIAKPEPAPEPAPSDPMPSGGRALTEWMNEHHPLGRNSFDRDGIRKGVRLKHDRLKDTHRVVHETSKQGFYIVPPGEPFDGNAARTLKWETWADHYHIDDPRV